MLPGYWLHDRDALASSHVAVLRLQEMSPAGAIVDLRMSLEGFFREYPTMRHLIVDIREHDARCAGTRPAMWALADAAMARDCRITFIANSTRLRGELSVVSSDEEALASLTRQDAESSP
ncbi:MAG: hypothetical protein U0744_18875 [Gemmataceae bacterium]